MNFQFLKCSPVNDRFQIGFACCHAASILDRTLGKGESDLSGWIVIVNVVVSHLLGRLQEDIAQLRVVWRVLDVERTPGVVEGRIGVQLVYVDLLELLEVFQDLVEAPVRVAESLPLIEVVGEASGEDVAVDDGAASNTWKIGY